MRIYKERRVYYFACSKCGSSNRQSLKRAKARAGVCRKCRKVTINKDQIPLFDIPEVNVGVVTEIPGSAKPGDILKVKVNYPLEEV